MVLGGNAAPKQEEAVIEAAIAAWGCQRPHIVWGCDRIPIEWRLYLPTVRCLCLPFAKLSQSSHHQHLSKNFLKVCLPSLYYFAYLLSTTVTLDLEPFCLIDVSQRLSQYFIFKNSRRKEKKKWATTFLLFLNVKVSNIQFHNIFLLEIMQC